MNHEIQKPKTRKKEKIYAYVKNAYTLTQSDAYGHLSLSCDDSSRGLCR